LKEQAIRAADRDRLPDEIREMKTGEFVAKDAEIKPIRKIAERKKFPEIRRFEQELIKFGPRRFV
jgi:hypothetical protein